MSNATSWVKGASQRPLRHPGAVPQVRSADRGAAARRLHLQRTVHRQPGRRLPARLLLDLHRRVRQLTLELQLADLRAVHRRQLAGLVAADAADGAALGVPRAVARAEQPGRLVRSGRAARSRSTWCRPTCRRAGPADHQPGQLLSFGHPEEGSQQLRSARRRGLQRQRQDGGPQRLRRLLRQPEPERAAVLAARAAVLRSVFAAAGQDRPQLERRHAVSGPEQHPGVPGAVLDESRQPHRLHVPVERQRAAHLRQELPVRGGVHRQPQLQRAQALQHQPGARPAPRRS